MHIKKKSCFFFPLFSAEESGRESLSAVEEAVGALKEVVAQQGAEIIRLQDALSQVLIVMGSG